MKIKSHTHLKKILKETAKSSHEKILEIRSNSEMIQRIKYNLCSIEFGRYTVDFHHIISPNNREYVDFRSIYNNKSCKMEEREIYLIAQILQKKGIMMPLFPKQINFKIEPTEESIKNAFHQYILTERKVHKAKEGYLEKLAEMVP